MLSAFDRTSSSNASWQVSQANWSTTASNNWTVARYWNDTTYPWPVPDNFFDINPAFTIQRYTRPHAVWSGLDDVAVIVATAEMTGGEQPQADVVALTSIDGGVTFTNSQILSIPFAPASDSGGSIDPRSVYVAQPKTINALGADMGAVSEPIYVVWYNDAELEPDEGWWMTKFVVSVDANGPNAGRSSIAQIANPRKITAIPSGNLGLVAIDGHQTFSGEEAVTLYWSERTQPLPSNCTNPNQTIAVEWKSAYSIDWGQTWTDFGDIASDASWRPCMNGGSTSVGHNNDRPVPVTQQGVDLGPPTNAEAGAAYYVAINKNVSGSQKIALYRWDDWSTLAWDQVFESESEGDAWGQSMAVHVGKWDPVSFSTSGVQALIWRSREPSGNVFTMGSTQATFQDNWSAELPLSTSYNMTQSLWGDTYNSVAIMQTCLYDIGGTCATTATWPDIPALGLWTVGTGIRARKFEH